jgi:hypothetical protein
MPVAGNRTEDRANAHIRWAERYIRAGDVDRAISHFGRAIEYNRRRSQGHAPHFGAGDVSSALAALAPAVAPAIATAATAAAAAFSLLCKPGSQCTAPPKPACDLCEAGGPIDRGVHGAIYNKRDDPRFVVKVLKDPTLAKRESRMMDLMLEITRRTNGAYRSLQASLVDSGRAPQLVIERYISAMRLYLFDSDKIRKDDKIPKKLREKDGVEKKHFLDILDQFRILHRFGVAHGDAHGGNVGLVGRVGQPEQRDFVIADPTKAIESPLSDLIEIKQIADGRPFMTAALQSLRDATKQGDSTSKAGYKYALNKKITDLDADEALLAFVDNNIGKLAEQERREAAGFVGGLVDEHNRVVDLMLSDWETLRTVMQGYTQNDKEFNFSDDERGT